MNYAQELVSEIETKNSAYIQFITGRGREDFEAYAFVEDDDDTVFYQHALDNLENIMFVGCGGKEGVLAVYRKTNSDGISDGQLFFVDRDTEHAPFEAEKEVLRTTHYSWESHLCQTSVVVRFFQRKINPNLSKTECNDLEKAWVKTIVNFRELLALDTSLVKMSGKLNPTLGMRKISLTRNARRIGAEIEPDLAFVVETLNQKIETAVSRGADRAEILDRKIYYESTDPLATAKGKTLYQIFREFSAGFINYIGRHLIVDANNASLVLASLSSNDNELIYIKKYAASRLLKR